MEKPKKQIIFLVVVILVVVGVFVFIKNKEKFLSKNTKETQAPQVVEVDTNKALKTIPSFLLAEKDLNPISAYEFTNQVGDKQVVVKLEASKEVLQESLVKLYESALKTQKDWLYINSTKVENLVVILAEKQDRTQGIKITLFAQEKEKPQEVELLLTIPKNIPTIKK